MDNRFEMEKNVGNESKIIGEGGWGTCTWTLDDCGLMTITEGLGRSIHSMTDVPWHKWKEEIRYVQILGSIILPQDASLNHLFYGCEQLVRADLTGLHTETVTTMNSMFHSCGQLTELIFGETFQVGRVKDMSRMFHGCGSLRQLDLSGFDTSSVRDMSSMFENCYGLEQLDLSEFDTSNVISISWMFRNCSSLTELDVSCFNTVNVTGMSGVFSSCSSIEYIDLSGFDTSNVINMISLFMNCKTLAYADVSGFDTARVTDMSWMFCNCNNLKTVDVSGFDTSNVMDMSCMFCSCSDLPKVDVSGFNTSHVVNMENMFMYCSSLKCLDLTSFDTSKVSNINDMFTGCLGLASVTVGEDFHFDGDGSTQCFLPTVISGNDGADVLWKEESTGEAHVPEEITGGKAETYYIKERDFLLSYHANGGIGKMAEEEGAYSAESTPEVASNRFQAPENYVFKEWNTRCDGTGTAYTENSSLQPICKDTVLYAVWAAAPTLGKISQPEPITYGAKMVLDVPALEPNNGEITEFGLEISQDGTFGWETYDPYQIPSVSLNGYFIRYYAKNFVGTAYTNMVQMLINKGTYDMQDVHWEYQSSFIYDQKVKQVLLVGLPEGVTAQYMGNEEVDTGIYQAEAHLYYDVENYHMPEEVPPFQWEIRKAQYDMSDVKWDYQEAFVYDGKTKGVFLTGLPEGVQALYSGNEAVDAGIYSAFATFVYDERNYFPPDQIGDCSWEIQKAVFDMDFVEWNYQEPFTYDGEMKMVTLTGLPHGVSVSYDENIGIMAGSYTAAASFSVEDEHNYQVPEARSCSWEIRKAEYDLSAAFWAYEEPFTFDGSMKNISLCGLPQGVEAAYYGNSGVDVGEYEANAILSSDDPDNYVLPEMPPCSWSIQKAEYDLSRVQWVTREDFVYDGEMKSVELTGLPVGVTALYKGNRQIGAGDYTASAEFTYDEHNYHAPQVESCRWTIRKADVDLSHVEWSYREPLVYCGSSQSIFLKGLPEGVSAEYRGNSQVDAGRYQATAVLSVEDTDNYHTPEIAGCDWEIQKADYDMTQVTWEDTENLFYTGKELTVQLTGLPEGLSATYSGNRGVNAGSYHAEASLSTDDPKNYNVPEVEGVTWEIKKGHYDMSQTSWNGWQDLVYDGTEKTVALCGLPEGVTAQYQGNVQTNAGKYTASAELIVEDPDNYQVPEVEDRSWRIEKAEYDMSKTAWDYTEAFLYDGTPKTIALTGLPEGVTARYSENTAIYVATYIASAVLDYDGENYEMPVVENCRWDIEKAPYDLGEARWNYEEAFTYNGEEQSIYLVDLPQGVTAKYQGNSGVDTGIYDATAELFLEDENNYKAPVIEGCSWVIQKAECDLRKTHWNYESAFSYDGTAKTVTLENLPKGVTAQYRGNQQINAGSYTAHAVLSVDDERNYEIPEFPDCSWEIAKADMDMSQTVWTCQDEELIYDGTMKSVTLRDLPPGVTAEYQGNTAITAGWYEAQAVLSVEDPDNYRIPDIEGCRWQIGKQEYDMSQVKWDEQESYVYDGTAQSIGLTGLPQGVTADYGEECTRVDAGIYQASAVLSVEDPENYQIPQIAPHTWEIKKASYDLSETKWTYEEDLVYDGTVKSVVLEGLPSGVTVGYSGNRAIDAGSYVARAICSVEDKRNYQIPEVKDCSWEIQKAEYDMSRTCWTEEQTFVYDGTLKGVYLRDLPEGVTPIYRENEAAFAGEYQAEAEFEYDQVNYCPPAVEGCSWEIRKAVYDMSRAQWSYSKPFVYDGTEKQVYLTGLPQGVSAVYQDNQMIEAGQYTAEAELEYDAENYEEPAMEGCNWEIQKAVYDLQQVEWTGLRNFTYDGSVKGVYLIGLPKGIQPNYRNNEAAAAGSYTAEAQLDYDRRNYEEPEVKGCLWEIQKAVYDLDEAAWDYSSPFVYDGNEKQVLLTGLPQGIQPIYCGNAMSNAGIYTAEATFEYDWENYEEPVVESCRWEIQKAAYDLSDLFWAYDGAFTYDGQEKSVELKRPEPKQSTGFFKRLFRSAEPETPALLPEGVRVNYRGNCAVDAGTYTAEAIFDVADPENFEIPTVPDFTWEIEKAVYEMSHTRWNYHQPFVYDGIEKTVELMGVPDGITPIYSGNSGVNAGSYQAEVRLVVEEPDNYEIPEPLEGCTWKIDKGSYDMSGAGWDYQESFLYDGREKFVHLVGLPEGVTAECRGNSAIDAGTYTATAVLNIADERNHHIPEIEGCKWRIRKASYDMRNVDWDYQKPFTYDDGAKTIRLKGLPDGVTASYQNNSQINAGTYIAQAELSYDDVNYQQPIAEACKWRINKAEYDMNSARWNYQSEFFYDGTEKSVELVGLPDGVIPHYEGNRAINPGTYTATVSFEYDDTNYREPNCVRTCRWVIKQDEAENIDTTEGID